MAAMFIIGLGAGTWMSGDPSTAAVAASEQREHATSSEPTLTMDYGLEAFGERAAATTPASALPAQPAGPAPAASPSKRNVQTNNKPG